MHSFTEMLRWIADKTILKTSASPKHLMPPWLDESCQRVIKEQKKAQHRFHWRLTADNLALFGILCTCTHRTTKEACRQCWSQFVSGIIMGTMLDTVWTIFRRLKRRGDDSSVVPHLKHNSTILISFNEISEEYEHYNSSCSMGELRCSLENSHDTAVGLGGIHYQFRNLQFRFRNLVKTTMKQTTIIPQLSPAASVKPWNVW